MARHGTTGIWMHMPMIHSSSRPLGVCLAGFMPYTTACNGVTVTIGNDTFAEPERFSFIDSRIHITIATRIETRFVGEYNYDDIFVVHSQHVPYVNCACAHHWAC